MIIASLAYHSSDLIFKLCSMNYKPFNDLKVGWTRIAKLCQLREW